MVLDPEQQRYELGKRKYRKQPDLIHQMIIQIDLDRGDFFGVIRFLSYALDTSMNTFREHLEFEKEKQEHFSLTFVKAEIDALAGIYQQVQRICRNIIEFPTMIEISYFQFYFLTQKMIWAISQKRSTQFQPLLKLILQRLWLALEDEEQRFEVNGMVAGYLKDRSRGVQCVEVTSVVH